MAYETKAYQSNKGQQKALLNGQWTDENLTQMQKLIQKPETAHLGGKEMKTNTQ